MTPDDAKLRELILYTADRSRRDPGFSKTKLYKVLFYADFSAFAERGEAITGQPYKKFPRGPVPPRALELIEDLEERGEAHFLARGKSGKQELRLEPLREPDLSLFSADELERVDKVIERLWGEAAIEVSRESAGFLGWQIAYPYEVIPYETALVDMSPVTPAEEAWLNHLVAEGRIPARV